MHHRTVSNDTEGRSPNDELDALLARVEALVRASEARILEAVRLAAAAGEDSTGNRLDAIFAQVEALLSLRDILPFEHPLPPTRRWASSPDLLVSIVRHMESSKPSLVVELGSGVSTVVIAASLRRSGSGHVLSLEHDERFGARTRAELARQGLSALATVIDAPLGDVTVRGELFRWYTLPPDAVPPGIGLVFVDGPPGVTGPLARYPALPVLFDRLAPGAAIILDDGARPDEREIVARWQREFAGFDTEYLPLEKGAWVLSRGL